MLLCVWLLKGIRSKFPIVHDFDFVLGAYNIYMLGIPLLVCKVNRLSDNVML